MCKRMVGGRIVPGRWDEFEAAVKAAMASRGELAGLRNHWLARDRGDPNAGYSITLCESEAAMRLLGKPAAARGDGAVRALLCQPVHGNPLRGALVDARLSGGS